MDWALRSDTMQGIGSIPVVSMSWMIKSNSVRHRIGTFAQVRRDGIEKGWAHVLAERSCSVDAQASQVSKTCRRRLESDSLLA